MDWEYGVRELYGRLLRAWNQRSAEGMAALFREDGRTVGFDGSVHEGPARMREELAAIFASHATGAFVARVRGVVRIGADAAVLHAVAGMVPPGGDDLNPAVNAVQSLVAERSGEDWRIVLFQNTPAAHHGRPEASAALTGELREVLRSGATVS